MRNKIFAMAAFFAASLAYGQEFKGMVLDANTKDPIPFASVYITNVQIGTKTDSTGYFEFTTSLPDHLEVRVSAQLFESSIISIHRTSEKVTFELASHHIDFDDVVVSASLLLARPCCLDCTSCAARVPLEALH